MFTRMCTENKQTEYWPYTYEKLCLSGKYAAYQHKMTIRLQQKRLQSLLLYFIPW